MSTTELCALNAATKRARSIAAIRLLAATTKNPAVVEDCKIILAILESM